MRTTVDIADPVLKEVKRLQQKTGHSLGQLISDLLARSLADARDPEKPAPKFHWISRPMTAKVDLLDKDAILDAMDERHR